MLVKIPKNELILLRFDFLNLDDKKFNYEYKETREVFKIVEQSQTEYIYVPTNMVDANGLVLTNRPKKMLKKRLDKLQNKVSENNKTFWVWTKDKTEEELALRVLAVREMIEEYLLNQEKAVIQMQNVFVNYTGFSKINDANYLDKSIMLCINCYWWNYQGSNEGVCGCKTSKFFKRKTQNNSHCTSFKMDAKWK